MSKLPFKMPHVNITLLRGVSNFPDFPWKYVCTFYMLSKFFVKTTVSLKKLLSWELISRFFIGTVGNTDFKTPSTKKQFTKEIASQYEKACMKLISVRWNALFKLIFFFFSCTTRTKISLFWRKLQQFFPIHVRVPWFWENKAYLYKVVFVLFFMKDLLELNDDGRLNFPHKLTHFFRETRNLILTFTKFRQIGNHYRI